MERLLWGRLSLEGVEIPFGRREIVTVTAEDLRELVDAVRERTFSYEAGRERFRERLAGMLASRAARPRLAGRPGGGDQRRAQDEGVPAHGRPGPGRRRRPRRLVEQAVQEPRAAGARPPATCSSDEEIALLLKSSAAIKRKDMTPTDVALLDEAHWLIDPSFRRFGHVVVDEAQNLTPMELRMTVRRARGQSLTILGDLSQRTADAGVSSWERRAATRPASSAHVVSELRVSYRVPNEFLALAGALLPAGRAGAARRARRAVPRARDRTPTTSAPRPRGSPRVRGGGRQRRRRRRRTRCMDEVRAALGPTSSTPPTARRWAPAST